MIRKYVLSILAVVGFALAIYTVHAGNRPTPAARPVVEPSQAPYASYVAGAGIVEARSRNIAIGAPLPGVVAKVFVEVGQSAKAGDPLFELEHRNLDADLGVRRAALEAAKAQVEKLKQQPRPEDVPPAEARVRAAQSALDDARAQVTMWESVEDKRAVSQDVLDRRRFAVRTAEANLVEAQAQLDLLKAGAWAADIQIAQANVDSAQSQVEQAQTEIERRTIRAPVDGQVLQLNVRVGEYAATGALQEPLIMFGSVERLHVRVDVDENDAWRVREGAKATAYLRGNAKLKTDLTFVRFEPFVVPKKSLTGGSTERVDTRVLQVIYSFKRTDLPVYVGQLMDVFIDAPPVGDAVMATERRQPESPDSP